MPNLSTGFNMVSMQALKSKFFFIANDLAVDFTNTSIVDHGEEIDLLENTEDLVNWAGEAGFIIKSETSSTDMATTKELRNAIRELLIAKLDDTPTPSKPLNILNIWLPKGLIEQRLDETEGQFVLSPSHNELSVEMLLGRIAHSAALLLSSTNITKLKRCANSKCVMKFVDISRSGKRRWCSMTACGNRAKAATHYLNSKQSSQTS